MDGEKTASVTSTDLYPRPGSVVPLVRTDGTFPATSPISAMQRDAVPAAELIDAERVGLSSKADSYMHFADLTVTPADQPGPRVAAGRSNALIVCDGRRHSSRVTRGGKCYSSTAQSCCIG